MTHRASNIDPPSAHRRDVVQEQDVADAVLQIAAAVDEWLQSGTVRPDRALHVMFMLMVIRDFAVPLPPGAPSNEDDPVTSDLRTAVQLLRETHNWSPPADAQ